MDIGLGHAFPQALEYCFVNAQRSLASQVHQSELVRGFDRAAAGCRRRRADEFELGNGSCDRISEDEPYRFLDSQCACRNSPVAQALRHALVRTLILLPHANVRRVCLRAICELLFSSRQFKRRTSKKRLALGGQDHRKHPLAFPPLDSAEVAQRGARHEQNGVHSIRVHQTAGFLLALSSFLSGDGLRLTFQ